MAAAPPIPPAVVTGGQPTPPQGPPLSPLTVKVPILPGTAVGFAWGLTIAYSTVEAANERALEIKSRMKKISDDFATPFNSKDRQFIDSVFSAVDSSLRTLLSTRQGWMKNVGEVDELMKTQVEKINSIDKVSTDAQSAIPRIFATGAGLSAPFVLLQALGISPSAEVIAALGAIFGGAGYGIYQLRVRPWIIRSTQKVLLRTDYKRNLYFKQYAERSQATLVALFNEVLDIYRSIYGTKFDDRYDDLEEVNKAVNGIMGSMRMNTSLGPLSFGLVPKWCPYIHKHYHDEEITPELWSSCESGEGIEKCPLYQREERLRKH